MTSDERVSPVTSEPSQSTESVGEILRTDGRTHEDNHSPIDISLTSVPRTRILPGQQFGWDWRRYAPANSEPHDMLNNIDAWLCDYDASLDRLPIIRTGTREPICWHLRSMVKQRDHYKCRWCGADHRYLHIDHITPWSAGGEHDSRNLQVLCAVHNEFKSNYPEVRTSAPGVVLECVRCREPGGPTSGDSVWCFSCREFSNDRKPWVDLAQRFLLGHCEEILPPENWTKDVASYERRQLIWSWQEWYPAARDEYEAELRLALRNLILEHRAQTRGLPPAGTA